MSAKGAFNASAKELLPSGTTETMTAENMKRGFNRLFIVATVALPLYRSVIWPVRRQAEEFTRAQASLSTEVDDCTRGFGVSARKSETIKLDSQKYNRDNRGNHVERNK